MPYQSRVFHPVLFIWCFLLKTEPLKNSPSVINLRQSLTTLSLLTPNKPPLDLKKQLPQSPTLPYTSHLKAITFTD